MSADREPAGPPSGNKDLNQLLHAHQIGVMEAGSAPAGESRAAFFDKVAQIAAEIRLLRNISPKAELPEANSEPHTIVYGSYAGESETDEPPASASPHFEAETRAGSENPDRGHADR